MTTKRTLAILAAVLTAACERAPIEAEKEGQAAKLPPGSSDPTAGLVHHDFCGGVTTPEGCAPRFEALVPTQSPTVTCKPPKDGAGPFRIDLQFQVPYLYGWASAGANDTLDFVVFVHPRKPGRIDHILISRNGQSLGIAKPGRVEGNNMFGDPSGLLTSRIAQYTYAAMASHPIIMDAIARATDDCVVRPGHILPIGGYSVNHLRCDLYKGYAMVGTGVLQGAIAYAGVRAGGPTVGGAAAGALVSTAATGGLAMWVDKRLEDWAERQCKNLECDDDYDSCTGGVLLTPASCQKADAQCRCAALSYWEQRNHEVCRMVCPATCSRNWRWAE